MVLNSSITAISEVIAASINGGAGSSRQSLGGGGTAFGWAASGGGLPNTIASYATTTTSDGMSFPIIRVSETVTPAKVTAPAAQKAAAVAVASSTVNLQKFAGMGTANLEDYLTGAGLGAAISQVLGASCLKAFEADAVAALDAATATPVTGTDWISGVAAGQAQLLGKGGSPSVLVVSAADYGGFISDVSTSAGFAHTPESPIGAVFGSIVHVSPGAPAGKAYLFDAAAVVCVQHSASPLITVDVSSLAHLNQVRIVVDLIAATFVANSAMVVELSAPVARGASSEPTPPPKTKKDAALAA